MTTSSKLSRLVSASAIAVALLAGPAVAVADVEDDVAPEELTEVGEEGDEEGRIQMAETPRDRVGLFMLGALGLMVLAGAITATRQLGGKRPQADGEFRWR